MFGKKHSFTEIEMNLLLALLEKKIIDLNTAEKYFLLYVERFYAEEYASAIFTVFEKAKQDKAKTDENN